MRVAITGASGLIGTALRQAAERAGHETLVFVRRSPGDPTEIEWDPDHGTVDLERLDGVDAVVHLAGEPIGARWTAERRRRVLESRVAGTGTIARVVAALDPRPALVCASAIGVYGNRGDEILTERSTRGDGFLADVVTAWEHAAEPARDAGARVVHLRTGIVLDEKGGALERLLLPFRFGVGGRVGTGRQWWSWISLDDTIAAYLHAVTTDQDGAVNATAPNPVTNADFVRTLGKSLRRPAVLPLPALAVRLGFGQMGREMLLEGQRVLPERLLEAGFGFSHPTLDHALRAALRR